MKKNAARPTNNKQDFTIRWDHKGPPPFACIPAKTVVTIIEYHKRFTLQVLGESVECENVARVKIEGAKNPLKAEGYVNALYIEHPEKTQFSEVESNLISSNPYSPELIRGRWFLGVCSPLDAARRLLSNPSIPYGHYAVCQPSETLSLDRGKYPTYMIAVKVTTGSVDQYIHEWFRDEVQNFRFGKNYPERKTFADRIPSTSTEPLPSIVYFKVERTDTGLYKLRGGDESFHSLFALLQRYRQKNPVAQVTAPVQLLAPACISPRDTQPPRPPLYPSTKCVLSNYMASSQLVLASPGNMSQFSPRIYTQKMGAEEEPSESGLLYRAHFKIGSMYRPVSIRRLNEKRFNPTAFQEDLNLLDLRTRASHAALNDLQKKGIDPRGHDYVFQVISHNAAGDVFGKWVAYEYTPGLPLDQLLRIRKFEADFIANRPKFEIMYQVAAGMRFLELNGLCHRHLKAGNVIVVCELPYLYRIKISDYMLPYHFLDNPDILVPEQHELDWPWWAPEIFEKPTFGIRSDVWAFGCVIFEIMSDGLVPWAYERRRLENKEQLREFLKSDNPLMTTIEPNSIQPLDGFCTDVIYRCLRKNIEERPSFVELFDFFNALLFDFAAGPLDALKEFFKNDATSRFYNIGKFEASKGAVALPKYE